MTGKKKKVEEPTIRDISEKLDFVLELVDKRFDEVDRKFNVVDKRFVALNQRMNGLDERVVFMDRKLAKIEVAVLDMQDDLRGALGAIDKDSEMLLKHERQIRRLEKAR